MKMLSHTLVALLYALAGNAHSQTVYRCGDRYSEQPCPGGAVVHAADPRTSEQRATHERQVRQDVRTADEMEKDRLKQEAAAARRAEQQAQAEQKAAQKSTPPKARQEQAKNRLPAYRAPAAPKAHKPS